jgi:hypothetical protein
MTRSTADIRTCSSSEKTIIIVDVARFGKKRGRQRFVDGGLSSVQKTEDVRTCSNSEKSIIIARPEYLTTSSSGDRLACVRAATT